MRLGGRRSISCDASGTDGGVKRIRKPWHTTAIASSSFVPAATHSVDIGLAGEAGDYSVSDFEAESVRCGTRFLDVTIGSRLALL